MSPTPHTHTHMMTSHTVRSTRHHVSHEWFKTCDFSSNDNNSNVEGRASNLHKRFQSSRPPSSLWSGSQMFRMSTRKIKVWLFLAREIQKYLLFARNTIVNDKNSWQAFCINFGNSNMRNSSLSFVKQPASPSAWRSCSIARYHPSNQSKHSRLFLETPFPVKSRLFLVVSSIRLFQSDEFFWRCIFDWNGAETTLCSPEA